MRCAQSLLMGISSVSSSAGRGRLTGLWPASRLDQIRFDAIHEFSLRLDETYVLLASSSRRKYRDAERLASTDISSEDDWRDVAVAVRLSKPPVKCRSPGWNEV